MNMQSLEHTTKIKQTQNYYVNYTRKMKKKKKTAWSKITKTNTKAVMKFVTLNNFGDK